MQRHPHILNAATNLLAICFVIVGGLKLANRNANTYADELAWLAAFLLLVSILSSYLAIRNNDALVWQNRAADWCFLSAIGVLFAAMMFLTAQL
jgi:hypothetical protein